MERFQENRQIAERKIAVADHMLTQTYPMIQDPKLLLSVLENIFLALSNCMSAILYHERLFKRIPPFHDNFDSRFNMFRSKIVNKCVDKKYEKLIDHIKDVIVQHRKSPVEFTRKDKVIICNGDYKIKTISIESIKEYLRDTKEFFQKTKRITNKELFRKGIGE